MGSLFSVPKAQPMARPPKFSDEKVKEAAAREQEAMKRRKGYAASIATGPQGVTNPATTVKTKLGD